MSARKSDTVGALGLWGGDGNFGAVKLPRRRDGTVLDVSLLSMQSLHESSEDT
jgi:hypothetical protein